MSQYPSAHNWPGAQAGQAYGPATYQYPDTSNRERFEAGPTDGLTYGNRHASNPNGFGINPVDAYPTDRIADCPAHPVGRPLLSGHLGNVGPWAMGGLDFRVDVSVDPRGMLDPPYDAHPNQQHQQHQQHEQAGGPARATETMQTHRPNLGAGRPQFRDKRPVYPGAPEEQQRQQQPPRPRWPVLSTSSTSGRDSRSSSTSQQAQVGNPESSKAAQKRQKNNERLGSSSKAKHQPQPKTKSRRRWV